MRILLLIILVVLVGAAAAFGLPLLNESTGTPCNALEKRFIAVSTQGRGAGAADPDLAALGRAFLGSLQGFSNGSFAAEYVRREHPTLPAGIGCVVEYWRTFLPSDTPQPRPR